MFGPTILNVTVEHLLHMNSGIQDYDDAAMLRATWGDPGHDLGPAEVVALTNKTFLCNPGDCLAYSSTGYELLGLVLATAAGASSWTGCNQLSVLPEAIRSAYRGTKFPLGGACNTVTDVQTYAANITAYNQNNGHPIYGAPAMVEMGNVSCLNGWVCGNLVSSTTDLARFRYDLFGSRHNKLLSGWAVTKMLDWDALDAGDWGEGTKYGLGTMFAQMPNFWWSGTGDDEALSEYVMHGGLDWGSGGLAGYHPALDFSFAATSNSDSYDVIMYDMAAYDLMCDVFPVLTEVLGNVTLPDEYQAAGCRFGTQAWNATTDSSHLAAERGEHVGPMNFLASRNARNAKRALRGSHY